MDGCEGKVDWNAVWMEQQAINANLGLGGGCPQAWASVEAARNYWQRAQNDPTTLTRVAELAAMLPASGSVLDIGAGPGNLALPLAEDGYAVTAVEPAQGMRQVLLDNIHAAGVVGVSVVPERWEDVDAGQALNPPYDLSVCCFALGMPDLRAAIEKMQAVTRGWIVLYWHAGDQPYDREARILWPRLFQREFTPIPKSDVVFNVLYQMGIYPHVEPLYSVTERSFDSFQAAEQDFCQRYAVDSAAQAAVIREYLQETWTCTSTRCWLRSQRAAMKFWWRSE